MKDVKFLSMADVANLLGVTKRTVATYKERNAIPYYQYGRVVRFKLEDVLAHIEAHTQNKKGGVKYA